MPSLRKLQRYSLRLLSSTHESPGTYVMYMVAKSGAPPSSCRSSAASDSIPPSGQREVNSGHSIAISYARPGYGFGNVSSSSGLGMRGRSQGNRSVGNAWRDGGQYGVVSAV